MIKCVHWHLDICSGQHFFFTNTLSVHVLLLVEWILTAPAALYHVLGDFLSLLLCMMAILFQGDINDLQWNLE